MTLGERVKQLRIENNLTLVKLSDLSKVGKSTISELETGISQNPSSQTLSKLAKVFGVSVEFLLTGNENSELGNENRTLNDIVNDKDDITDVEEAMQLILSRKNLMLSGKLLTDEDKLALANSLKVVIKLQENELKNKK